MENVFVTRYPNLFKNKQMFKNDLEYFYQQLSQDFELPSFNFETQIDIDFCRQKYIELAAAYLKNDFLNDENNFINLLTNFCSFFNK